jgi:hypothetical protein
MQASVPIDVETGKAVLDVSFNVGANAK